MTAYNIDDFFSKRFENESTKLLKESRSFFSIDTVLDYINQLIDKPLSEYLSYLKEHPNTEEISSKDITQLSSIVDCTTNMCKILLDNDNKGMTFTGIATALHGDDNYKDNDVALTKYGENQAKTAAQLGLVFLEKDLWFLTAVGAVYLLLSDYAKQKYLAINLLRDPFYSKVILSLCEHDTNIRDFMSILSTSTQQRRASSCNRVLSFFISQCNEENYYLHNLSLK